MPLGAGVMPTHRRTVPHSSPGFRVTETSRINADLQLVSEGTPRFQFPSPDLHHFPSLYSCFRCHCLSFGHYPKSTDLSFFWDNGGMASFLRVATLWIWIQPCRNGIPISCCDVVLRIASLNPYTTIPFKRELFLVFQRRKKMFHLLQGIVI